MKLSSPFSRWEGGRIISEANFLFFPFQPKSGPRSQIDLTLMDGSSRNPSILVLNFDQSTRTQTNIFHKVGIRNIKDVPEAFFMNILYFIFIVSPLSYFRKPNEIHFLYDHLVYKILLFMKQNLYEHNSNRNTTQAVRSNKTIDNYVFTNNRQVQAQQTLRIKLQCIKCILLPSLQWRSYQRNALESSGSAVDRVHPRTGPQFQNVLLDPDGYLTNGLLYDLDENPQLFLCDMFVF